MCLLGDIFSQIEGKRKIEYSYKITIGHEQMVWMPWVLLLQHRKN